MIVNIALRWRWYDGVDGENSDDAYQGGDTVKGDVDGDCADIYEDD